MMSDVSWTQPTLSAYVTQWISTTIAKAAAWEIVRAVKYALVPKDQALKRKSTKSTRRFGGGCVPTVTPSTGRFGGNQW